MGGLIRQKIVTYRIGVRTPHPISQGMASSMGDTWGKGINGDRGTKRIGYPTIGLRNKFAGYVNPPQLFIGWSPSKVAGGAIRVKRGELPGTSAPSGTYTPMEQALAAAAAMRTNRTALG